MVKLQKLEIITEKRSLETVIEMIDNQGVTGYTIIENVTGKGKRGTKLGDDLNDVFRNVMVITVCDEEQAQAIIQNLKIFLKKISGIVIVSEVSYVLH